MSCPICSHTELEEGAENCTKCGSDLEIFTHINAVHKAETFQRKSMLVLTAMLGIVMVSWGSASLFSGDNEVTAVTETTDVVAAPNEDPLNLAAATKPVEEFVAENEVKPEVAPINKEAEVKDADRSVSIKPQAPAPVTKTPAVKEKVKVKPAGPSFEADGYIFHKVRKGDSFWKISKRYFGNGSHAKQIAADNNLNPKKNIPLGTKLKINK